MRISIKVDKKHDNSLLELILSDDNSTFSLELVAESEKAATTLRRMIQGGIRAREAENPVLQHFKIIYDEDSEKSKTVKLAGNIYNALLLMHNMELISDHLFSNVNQDEEAQPILSSSKKFQLPKEESPLSKDAVSSTKQAHKLTLGLLSTSTTEQKKEPANKLPSQQDFYEEYLVTTDQETRDRCLKHLAEFVSSLGYECTFSKKPKHPSQAVSPQTTLKT